jgi:mRNA interferase HigB
MAQAERYGDCLTQVRAWYQVAARAHWRSLAEVRAQFPHADLVGDKAVFNVKGNDYRLIVHVSYRTGTIYVKHLLTHGEYERGAWKN